MEQPRRQRIRLERSAYQNSDSTWPITTATHLRQPHFADGKLGGACAALLQELSRDRAGGLPLYCFMPDHLHLIAEPRGNDVIEFVRAYESLSTRVWRGWNAESPLWQRSFHDRGLRTPAEFDSAVIYVLENPLRGGLVDAWERYDLLGGHLIVAR